jgi:hypothetical protein
MTVPPYGDLKVGGTYLSLQCANLSCKKIIPLGPSRVPGIPVQGFGVLRVQCPFCGKTYDYTANRALMRDLKELPPEAH